MNFCQAGEMSVLVVPEWSNGQVNDSSGAEYQLVMGAMSTFYTNVPDGPYMPALANNPVVLDENPSSLINVVLNGSVPLVAVGTAENPVSIAPPENAVVTLSAGQRAAPFPDFRF